MKREAIDSIELRNMCFHYREEEPVLQNVDFNFPAGEAIFLKGPMGSGKSTVMKILTGLLAPSSGDYLINGARVNEMSHREFDKYRLNIGYSFDSGGLINNKSLIENLLLPLNYHGFLENSERVDYVRDRLRIFKLQDQADIRPGNLTAGARKAASILKAFLLDPEVVLLNDPTVGLNSEHIIELLKLVREHQEKKNLKHVIISSDDVSFNQKLKGTTVYVYNNKINQEEHHLRMVNL